VSTAYRQSNLAVTAKADNREPIQGFSTRTRNHSKSGAPQKRKKKKDKRQKTKDKRQKK